MKKKIHSVSCLTRVYLCAEIETIWIFDPCHKNLIFVRFLHGCPLNKDHLLYTSLANSSHGGSSIRPSKILLRHNTYVRTNDYINQIYLNAHIIPWSCLSKHSPYGFNYLLKAYFRCGVCVTTHIKEFRAHLTNSVEPFQSSWTNGKQFA